MLLLLLSMRRRRRRKKKKHRYEHQRWISRSLLPNSV
jgi:hypothetical protein